jgi:hypothetical protein
MSKASSRKDVREFDFSNGVRGKYAARIAGANVAMIEPELASVFRDSRAVNRALRAYRDKPVRALIAELGRKPPRTRQKAIRDSLRKLGHPGGLRTSNFAPRAQT